MKPLFHISTFQTPVGRFSVAVDTSGAVAATAFGGEQALRGRVGRGTWVRDPRRTAAARREIKAWLRNGSGRFLGALAPKGTPFQRRVWDALLEIPFGHTTSYGALARTLGSSPRAVGRAVGSNPICLIIPCHRVVGADGSLTGFAFGVALKRRLLEDERRKSQRRTAA